MPARVAERSRFVGDDAVEDLASHRSGRGGKRTDVADAL